MLFQFAYHFYFTIETGKKGPHFEPAMLLWTFDALRRALRRLLLKEKQSKVAWSMLGITVLLTLPFAILYGIIPERMPGLYDLISPAKINVLLTFAIVCLVCLAIDILTNKKTIKEESGPPNGDADKEMAEKVERSRKRASKIVKIFLYFLGGSFVLLQIAVFGLGIITTGYPLNPPPELSRFETVDWVATHILAGCFGLCLILIGSRFKEFPPLPPIKSQPNSDERQPTSDSR